MAEASYSRARSSNDGPNLAELLDRPIAFHRAFVRLGAGVTGALMLSQAIYWGRRTNDADGWFFKTQAEWEDETGLSRFEQEGARRKLKEVGVLEEVRRGVPARLFYRVDFAALERFLSADVSQTSMRKTSKLACGKPANKSAGFQQSLIEETTSETTTEIDSTGRASAHPGVRSMRPEPQSAKDELRAVLDETHAEAVIEHRKRIRKPLTAHAARLLAGKFRQCTDPNAAADAMIVNGWQGFEPSWLEGRERSPKGPAPPARIGGGTETLGQWAARQLLDNQRSEGGHVIEHGS